MTSQASHIDEWLNKAFQLAFFLHGDRDMAIKIALNAMAKLETASNAQFKRYYYTPTGRAEAARATRSRVSLNDLQLLQRLVFVESENFERQGEAAETVSESKLLTYFIKHLVRISLKRNSFYVTLGISRILHNYATSEAMEIYNVVVQDPERVHDDYYYRSRKGVLMKELKARFGDLLDIVRVNRGEERFQIKSESSELAETANESLRFFTPWNSSCAIPDKFDPFDDVIKSFHFDKDDPDAEHRIEVNRIHATLHPSCFSRLTDALNLPPPEEKMEIPKFMITQNQAGFDDNDWRNPPPLEFDELQSIKDILAAQAEGRKAMTANLLRIIVDGDERALVDLHQTDAARFDLDESSELIEIRAVGKSGESVLATHLLSFEDLEKGDHSYTVMLEGGQKVTFNFAPTTDAYGEVSNLACSIQYAETAFTKRFALAARRTTFASRNFVERQNWGLKPALAIGAVLLALSLSWLIFQNIGRSVERSAGDPIEQNQNNRVIVPVPPQEEIKNFDVARENEPKILKNSNQTGQKQSVNDRKPQIPNKRENEKFVQTPPNELRANIDNRPKEKEYTDENGILRLPIRQSNQSFPEEKIETRGTARTRGKSLSEIGRIYIEVTGDEILGKRIGDQIASDINAAGTIVVTPDKESADAALKMYVRHESDGDKREDASVAAIVRLVNAKGFVVYPYQKQISGWKYVGTTAKIPMRIAKDLIKGAESSRKPRR